MQLRSIRTAKVKNRRVLVRVDLNIETKKRGQLRDATRIESILPTLRWLLSHGAAVILLSHRGRPSRSNTADSLRPMLRPLAKLLGQPVQFAPDSPSATSTRRQAARLKPGQVLVLENLRFQSGEASNQPKFARQLSQLGDVYVNEAFAASHRKAASIVGLPKILPAYAGLRLLEEIKQLDGLVRHPRRPYVAVLGGAKISTKLRLVRQLLRQADHVLLGGALANTLLRAAGLAIGASLHEPRMMGIARGLKVEHKHLHIPCDVIVSHSRTRGSWHAIRPVGRIGNKEIIVDIGPDTVDVFARVLRRAATVVWNGPMGVYEQPPFDAGTKALAKLIARTKARSVVGGGETIDAVQSQRLTKKYSFVSTGGGAMLEYLEGKSLPGLRALAV